MKFDLRSWRVTLVFCLLLFAVMAVLDPSLLGVAATSLALSVAVDQLRPAAKELVTLLLICSLGALAYMHDQHRWAATHLLIAGAYASLILFRRWRARQRERRQKRGDWKANAAA